MYKDKIQFIPDETIKKLQRALNAAPQNQLTLFSNRGSFYFLNYTQMSGKF